MRRRLGFLLAILFALPVLGLRAEFSPYELLVSAEKPDERIADFFERNLPQSRLMAMTPQQRYQKFPQFPVAACHGVEYHLIALGSRLIAFGCLSTGVAAIELQAMRRAIERDRQAERRRSPTDLEWLVLASAAAGDFAAARRFAKELRQKQPVNANRLARLLAR